VKSTKNNNVFLFILSFCIVCFGTAWAQQKAKEAKEEGEKKLELKDVPAAVQKTVQEQSKGATIRGISKEVEAGKTIYELETMIGGHSRDMLIDSRGKVVEVEQEISVTSLPAAVQAEVKKSVGSGKLLKLESVTKGGTAAGYEAVVEKGGKMSEVSMGLDGKALPKEKE
jgi:hypothetical protein